MGVLALVSAAESSATAPAQVSVSNQLQIGKAAEHLVCADLLLQGIVACLADAGMPYDVLVDTGERRLRVQVKSSRQPYTHPKKGGAVYRFGTRKGRHYGRIPIGSIDVLAFVALDTKKIAYVQAEELVGVNGQTVGLVEFFAGSVIRNDCGRRGWGARRFERCAAFPLSDPDRTKWECFHCGRLLPRDAKHFVPNRRCRGGVSGICRECGRTMGTAAARLRRQHAKP